MVACLCVDVVATFQSQQLAESTFAWGEVNPPGDARKRVVPRSPEGDTGHHP